MDGAGPNPLYREYVTRLRAAAAEDEAIAYWAAAPPERHAEVLVELLDLTDALIRSRGRPVEKPPLPDEPFPWPSMRRDV